MEGPIGQRDGDNSGSSDRSREEDSEKSLGSVLDKAIYRMIDRANNWWHMLDNNMKRLGYKHSEADQSMRSREEWREDSGKHLHR